MSIISIIVVLIIVGVIMYLINNVVPIEGWIRTVLNAVVAICLLLWLLQVFGIHTGLPRIR